ncbi:MAG TPA: hypothetical protein VGF26_23955, partial [Ramlibacter sp.]
MTFRSLQGEGGGAMLHGCFPSNTKRNGMTTATRILPIVLAAMLSTTAFAQAPTAQEPQTGTPGSIERGRYLARIGGCNDCHTRGYAQSGGKVPENQWLTGDGVGWSGPWGTTYPANLRLALAKVSEQQ